MKITAKAANTEQVFNAREDFAALFLQWTHQSGHGT